MLDTITSHDELVDDDDIEWELACSAREVSGAFVPFANLDLMKTALKYAEIRAGTFHR